MATASAHGGAVYQALICEGRNCQLLFTNEALRLTGEETVSGPLVNGRQGQDSNPGLLEPRAHQAPDIEPVLLTYVLLGAMWGSLRESHDLHS